MATWRLRTSLSLLLVATTALTFTLVGTLILFYRIPIINDEALVSVQADAAEKARLLEFYLAGSEAQLRPVVAQAQFVAPAAMTGLLQSIVSQGDQFLGLYLVNSHGIVQAAAFANSDKQRAASIIGADLSRTPLFNALKERKSLWSDKHLSASSGKVVIGAGVRQGEWSVIGEMAQAALRDSVAAIAGTSRDTLLIVDRHGEWIADNQKASNHRENLGAQPIVRAALDRTGGAMIVENNGQGASVFVGSAQPQSLGWFFIVTRPAGMANTDIRRTVFLIGLGFIGALLVGLLVAPWWAKSLSQPLQRLIARTHRLAAGHYDDGDEGTNSGRSNIIELNELNDDLQLMTAAIRNRERSLAHSEERLRATIENSPALAVQWYDRDGICCYWNPASTLCYGYTAEETIGFTLEARGRSCEEHEAFVGIIREIERCGQAFLSTEFVSRHKDGRKIVLICSIFAIPDAQGGQQYVCLDIDITEQKLAESALLASQHELESIFNASPVPMSVSDVTTGFKAIKVNDAWVRQFGHTAESVIGKNGQDLDLYVDPEERACFTERFRFGPGIYDDTELWLKRADGSRLLCRVSSRLVQVGDEVLMLMASKDITEEQRLASELRHINEELEARVEQRTAALSEANTELEQVLQHLQQAQGVLVRSEKLAALGRLVAGVAHELNTPIGNGLMAISTLEDHHRDFKAALTATLRRSTLETFVNNVGMATEIALNNIHRAAELVSSFKQVAVDQTSSQRRIFDLKQVVDEVLLAIRPTLLRSTHRVEVSIEDGIRLESYPGPFGQALGNFVDNAIIHAFPSRSGGTVRIECTRSDENSICLTIADNGKGISPENLSHIFDPFFTTRLGQGGSGLGLNIVHNIVTGILGGSIEVASTLDEGTIFTLTLPRIAPVGTA